MQEVSSLYNKHAHADVETTSVRNEMITLRKKYKNQVCVARYYG
jgi:hypothetical protein